MVAPSISSTVSAGCCLSFADAMVVAPSRSSPDSAGCCLSFAGATVVAPSISSPSGALVGCSLSLAGRIVVISLPLTSSTDPAVVISVDETSPGAILSLISIS